MISRVFSRLIWSFAFRGSRYVGKRSLPTYAVVLLGALLTAHASASYSVPAIVDAMSESLGFANSLIGAGQMMTSTVNVTAPTANQVTPSSSFNVPITVGDITGDGIFSFHFNILYDPNVIDPTGAT